jgi:hypothetical protein
MFFLREASSFGIFFGSNFCPFPVFDLFSKLKAFTIWSLNQWVWHIYSSHSYLDRGCFVYALKGKQEQKNQEKESMG